jgi:hypothetical protein
MKKEMYLSLLILTGTQIPTASKRKREGYKTVINAPDK